MSEKGPSTRTMYGKVVDVISKAPDLRKDFEVQSILPWFRKKSQLFQKLKTDFLKDIIRNCRFTTKHKDEVIIRQGDLGECFYIILGGMISIYILNQEDLDHQQQDDLEVREGEDRQDGRTFRVTDRNKLGNFVCPLGAGEPFGEVALVSEDCVRTATVISDQTTDLVVVDRALYNRSVRDVLAKEFEEKTDFIKSTPLFANWAPKYRKQLAMAMYKETFPYEAALVKQGDTVENIYFIISGQVEVKIDLSSHSTQYPKLFPEEEKDFGERIPRKPEKNRPPTDVQFSSLQRKRDNSRCIKVCYLGMNASIGDTEVLMDMNTYLQSAICSEKTDVLVLEMKHYERLFVRRHPRTIEVMKQILEVKLNSRLALSVRKDMPLLYNLLGKLKEINNPSPPSEKPKKGIATYQDAEKEFLNHKGPLIDMWGPGSVFYAIRLREKLKSRMRFHSRPMTKARLGDTRTPATVQMATTLMIPAQTGYTSDFLRNEGHSNPAGFQNGNVEESKEPDFDSLAGNLTYKSQSAMGMYDLTDTKRYRVSSAMSRSGVQRGVTFLANSRLGAQSFSTPDEEASLSSLEDRMRDWLTKANPKGPVQVQQLRRIAVQNIDNQPKPGNKVVIRRRKRDGTTPDSSSDEEDDTRSFDHLKVLLSH